MTQQGGKTASGLSKTMWKSFGKRLETAAAKTCIFILKNNHMTRHKWGTMLVLMERLAVGSHDNNDAQSWKQLITFFSFILSAIGLTWELGEVGGKSHLLPSSIYSSLTLCLLLRFQLMHPQCSIWFWWTRIVATPSFYLECGFQHSKKVPLGRPLKLECPVDGTKR